MLRRGSLVVVCALAWLSPLQTGGEVDRILDAWEAKVHELKSFKCRFRQEKKVSFLRRPLVSTGTIAYRDRHLLWKTESPSEGFLSVDEKELHEIFARFLDERTRLSGGKAMSNDEKDHLFDQFRRWQTSQMR